MSVFNFKKLLKKKDTIQLIDGLASAMGIELCITDTAGTVIYGADSHNRHGLAVRANDLSVGCVYGEDSGKTAAITSLLNHLVWCELEKKALAAETLDKYNEITMLYDFVEKVNTLSVKEIANFLIKHVLNQIKADHVSVILKSKKTGRLEIIADNDTIGKIKTALIPASGIVETVMQSGKAEIINNNLPGPGCTVQISSLLCAAMKANDENLGVVIAGTKEPYNYCADDLKFFCTLVSLAAFAIDNARLYESLKEAFIKTVQALAETIEKRDPYTGGHTKRVMTYSIAIAETLGISSKDKERLELASVLHDIGKIGVSDSVLRKTSKLTDEEFEEIKKHPASGQEILSYIEQLKDIIPGIKSHHERFDGGGYPEGLKGSEIDLIARIIAVADSFDAMTSDRPYRKGLSFDVALTELRKCAGTQFDAEVVEAFFAAWNDNKIKPENSGDIN